MDGILLLVALTLVSNTDARVPRVLPADVTLTGPHASQRLVVVAEDAGDARADLTSRARFTTSAPAGASVDAQGMCRPACDGEATITAHVGDRTATARVRVVGSKASAAPSFRNHVIPVLTRSSCNSGACHGALAGKGGMKLSLRGYDIDTDHFVLTRQAAGRRIDREAPEKSLLLLKPSMAMTHGGGTKLEVDSADFRVIAEWIASGAPGPKENDVRIKRLEVLPSSAVLKPKDKLSLLVRAWYSDGHSEDVTRWAKFTSSEEQVANVDLDGRVTVAGHGEAAVSVWYSNLVASSTIVAPFPNQVEAKTFASAPRNNYIDELILKKLARLNLPPASECSDTEFIRRAFLDVAGILPTAEEVTKFLADKSKDKRAKLIDALLDRTEFV